MKSLDLRKTRATTVVNEAGEGDFQIFEEQKRDLAAIFENIEINPRKIIVFGIKIAICSGGVIALKNYEKKNISKLNGIKVIAQEEINTLKKKQKKLKDEIAKFQHLSGKTTEFHNKLDIVEEIANRRLSALRGLDGIQSAIPEEVWLKEVRYFKDNFKISGMSTNNRQVQLFIESLEKLGLFSTVTLEQSSEDKKGRTSRKNFRVVSVLK